MLRDDPDALRQRVGMVFQQFNLFPHMTVLRNITLALRRLKKLPEDEAVALARRSSRWSASPPRPTPGPPTSPAGSSSASPSPARWPCNRR